MTGDVSITLKLNGGGNPDAADDRYHENFNDGKLPHPEDVLGEYGPYELVGLYMRVLMQYVAVSEYILQQTSSDLDKNARLNKISEAVAGPMERWLDGATEFLPEWFEIATMLLSWNEKGDKDGNQQ